METRMMLLYLGLAVALFCVVSAVIGINWALKRKVALFTARKDLLFTPVCIALILPFLIAGLFIFVTLPLVPVCLIVALTYNIVKSVKLGSNPWEKWLIFSARSLLNFLSVFVILQIFNVPKNRYGADGADRLMHATFWAGVGAFYYRWLMRFVKEEQEGSIEAVS